MRLDQVRLLVDDFDASFRFYRDVIGLRPKWGAEGETYASFDVGTQAALALFDGAEMAETVGTASLPARAGARDRFVLVLEVEDVDAAAERVRAAGARIVTEPDDHVDWGIRTCHLRDPEGNLLELESPLAHPPG
jgi:lactoylglutathione lyase